jgi:protein farnesyltransferase subunit beta
VQYRHYHTDVSATSKAEFSAAFSWKYVPIQNPEGHGTDVSVFEESDRLAAFHPLYVIPHNHAERMRLWCENRPLNI